MSTNKKTPARERKAQPETLAEQLRTAQLNEKIRKPRDKGDSYYENATIVRSLQAGGKGTIELMEKYPNLIRVRTYKNIQTGETRKTVELPVD